MSPSQYGGGTEAVRNGAPVRTRSVPRAGAALQGTSLHYTSVHFTTLIHSGPSLISPKATREAAE